MIAAVPYCYTATAILPLLGVKTGKGFYDWSKRSIETDMAKRDQFIIEAVKAASRLDQTEAGGENR